MLLRCSFGAPAFHHSNALPINCTPQYEFHILADVRDRYKFDESLFSSNGNVIFPNFHAARMFAKKLNDARDLVRFPEKGVKAGQLNALGLIDEIYHYILRLYEESANPGVFKRAHNDLNAKIGTSEFQTVVDSFVALFPPLSVYKKELATEQYLAGTSEGRSNLHITIEELMLLYFANFNPAAAKFDELFTDKQLSEKAKYRAFIADAGEFFQD